MLLEKNPYEISLWEDQMVWHRRKLEKIDVDEKNYRRGVYYVKVDAYGASRYELALEKYNAEEDYFQLAPLTEGNFLEGTAEEIGMPEDWAGVPQIVTSFYKEIRICTIGSNSMDSLARCANPKLVLKVNGEQTLTFTMYYQYVDTMTGEKVYNPYINYLTNERKLKLKKEESDGTVKWYDFVIKDVKESSDSRAFNYTCKSQHISELSKSGFEIELDNELENNIGTVDELGSVILEGSDWVVEKGSNLYQFVEEPLYKIGITEPLNGVKDMETGEPLEMEFQENEIKYIYVFYSHINNQDKTIQFLYNNNMPFLTNDDLVIDKNEHKNYILSDVVYEVDETTGRSWPSFAAKNNFKQPLASFTTEYRGQRLVQQIQTKYDATIDKYVQVYTKEGGGETEYYGFTQSKYISPVAVKNYIVNPNSFTTTSGWYTEEDEQGEKSVLELVTDPPVSAESLTANQKFVSYLKFMNNGTRLMNSSISGFRSSMEALVEEETEYVIRLKYKVGAPTAEYETTFPEIVLGQYNYENTEIVSGEKRDCFVIEKELFRFEKMNEEVLTNEEESTTGYIYGKGVCGTSVSKEALINWDNRYGLFLHFQNGSDILIENVELFPYVVDDQNRLCVPGGSFSSRIETIYNYYLPNDSYKSIDDVVFSDQSTTELDNYKVKYREGADSFTKVRSITAKESNRFNLIQTLNETFQCWSAFRIERNQETGEILLGKDLNPPLLTGDQAYRQQKFISFRENVGEKRWIGFKYGINTKSISRTVDSNSIVSKMIVKDNANEFAPSGFCSIARADENPIKENFILNFDYYARQGLLDIDTVTNDLYLDSNGYLGYYKKLKEFNLGKDRNIELQTNLSLDIMKYTADYQAHKTAYQSAKEERLNLEDNIIRLIVPKENIGLGLSFEAAIQNYSITSSSDWTKNNIYIGYVSKWAQYKTLEETSYELYQKAEAGLQTAEKEYDSLSEKLRDVAEAKRALNLLFYKKYSRFIQEGSWIKEDYTDDNLYYLDSVSTLHTSSQPKVTYQVNVVDVSQALGLEGEHEYKDYQFNLGDITYVEDPDFFGWSLKEGQVPYREEIVISEMTQNLDSPEKDSIKVQNYKNQFENLFQRVAATTQQIEYHTGEYSRAAGIVESNGTISAPVLENSLANNTLRLQNAKDQSVILDEYGITTTSLANPSEMVRIVSGGVFMSTDGGATWKTGITGDGINSSYLTAGQINTDKIFIMNGAQPAFRWDQNGLSAYAHAVDSEGVSSGYNLNKYVRFDHYGIYGVIDSEWIPTTVNEVMRDAPFALTWEGFSLQNNDGSVKISSKNDIQVLDKQIERIKIGRLDEGVYGLRISDRDGSVMETDSNGRLWLKNRLSIDTYGANNLVGIGKLDNEQTKHPIHGGRVMDANGDFVVYEDGHIQAKSGQIGAMSIDSIERSAIKVEITSSVGNSMKMGTSTILAARVYRGGEEVSNQSLSYQWYGPNGVIEGATEQSLEIPSVRFEDGFVQYRCEITMTEEG